MTRTVFCTLLFAIPVCFLGCSGDVPEEARISGSGKKNTSTRDVPDFQAVEFTTFGEIKITVGEEKSVELTIDDNLTDIIETKVDQGKLTIKAVKRFTSGIGPVLAIKVPELKRVNLLGQGSISVENLKGGSLEISLPGSGNFTAEGEVTSVSAELTGSGNIELRKLAAKSVSLKLSGSGSAKVKAEESIKINSSGSGIITVEGNPKEVEQNVTGSGLVEFDKPKE